MSKMQLHDHDNATNPIEHKYQRVLLNLGGDTKTACDLLADIAGESGDLKDPNDEVLRTNSGRYLGKLGVYAAEFVR